MRGGRKHKHCGTCEELARRGRDLVADARDRVHREAIEAAPGEYQSVVTYHMSDPTRSWLDYADIEGINEPRYDCGETCDMCIPDWRERQQMLRKLEREKPTFTFAERILAQVGIKILLLRAS